MSSINLHLLPAMFRAYPIPFVAAAGLVVGAIMWLSGGTSDAGLAWYVTLLIAGAPLVYHTIRGILKGKFAADIVAMLAIITAVLTDEAFAGVIIVLMQSGGEALDDFGFKRASTSLQNLVARAPKTAHRMNKTDGSIEEVEAKKVAIGDAVVVRPGDLIPVDGILVQGTAQIDESALTGEPLPKSKGAGDPLMSGSVNVGQAFEMTATRVSTQSQYARIVELVRTAQQEKPPIQRLADRYAVIFTPLTIVVAAFGWVVTHSFTTVLAVLVIATPCPLILATPLAVISGVNRAAKESIIVKSGAAIEQMGRARAVIFDKTGTITFGTPMVERVIPLDGNPTEMLRVAASVEQLSSHPVAITLAREGEAKFGKLPVPESFIETPGQGVEADLKGQHVLIGSQHYCEQKTGREFRPEVLQELEKTQKGKRLTSFIVIDGKPAGAVAFTDQIRPGVPAMVQRLRELGIEETLMLTGDNTSNASIVAREAGIERVKPNLLPSQKVDEVKQLNHQYGTTIMVGDGINDAPALASATVGVAMGARGTGISSEAADVVLLVDDVTKVVDGISISRRMLRVAKESIFFGIGASLVLMVIASFGYIQPAIGALLQEAIDVTVILNALRAR